MKKVIFLLLIAAMACEGCTDDTEAFSKLKSPVILIGKNSSVASITVKDGDGQVFTYAGMGLAANIWNTRLVGDTLK